MFVQDEEERPFSTMRVCRPAEEGKGRFDEVMDEQIEPQQGFVNNPG
jgi:hypothetical protein